jgi:hypothetical protein
MFFFFFLGDMIDILEGRKMGYKVSLGTFFGLQHKSAIF